MAKVTIKSKDGKDPLHEATLENAATEQSIRELIAATKKEKFKPSKEQEKLQKDQEKLVKEQAIGWKNWIQDTIKERAEKRAAKTASALLDSAQSKLADGLGDTAESIIGASTGLTRLGAIGLKYAGPLGVALTTISGIGSVFGAGYKVIKEFFNSIAEGNTNLSSYIDTLAKGISNIPIFGGILGDLIGILGKVVGYLEEFNSTLFDLSKSGASFNNNLMEMRAAAAKTGLALSEFSNKITENAITLAQFSGTVTEGAMAFANLSKAALTTAGRKLMNMGFTVSDVNDGLLDYMDLNKAGAEAQQRSTTEMVESASELMIQFDAMAKLTGITRKQQADALKKEQNHAAYQMKLATMSEDERKKHNAGMAQMTAQFGPLGAEMYKLRVLGMPPITREAQLMAATMPEAYNEINKIADSAKNSGESMNTFTENMDKSTVKAMAAAMNSGKSMEHVLAAGAAGLGGTAGQLGEVLKDITNNSAKYLDKNGKLDEDKVTKAIANARAEQKKSDNVRDALNTFSLQIIKIRDALFTKVLQPIYEKIQPVLSRLSDWFEASGDSLSGGLAQIGEAVAKATEFFVKNIVTDEGRKMLMDKIIIFFEELFLDIREQLGKNAIARMAGIGITKGEADTQRSTLNNRKIDNELAAANASKEMDIKGAELILKKATDEAVESQAIIANATLERKKQIAILEKATDEKVISKAKEDLDRIDRSIAYNKKLLEAKEAAQANLAGIETNITNLETQSKKAKEEKAKAEAQPDKTKEWDDSRSSRGLKGMGVGAAGGAILGSVIPGIGTIVGGAVGGIVGGLTEFFRSEPDANKATVDNTGSMEGRLGGSLEEANTLIENFGKGTPMMLHGEEGILTKNQLFNFAEQGIQTGKINSQKEMREIIEEASSKFLTSSGNFDEEGLKSTLDSMRSSIENRLPALTQEAQSFKATLPSSLLEKLSNPLESAKEMVQSMVSTVKETVDKNVSTGSEIDKVAASIRDSVKSLATPNATREQMEMLGIMKAMLDEMKESNSINKRIEQYVM